MQITRLVVENLRSIDRIEIDLSIPGGEPRKRVVLLGVNGAGKTTILDAITHAFESLGGSSDMGASGLGAADVRNVRDPSLDTSSPPRHGWVTLDAVLSEEERRTIRMLYVDPPAAGTLRFGIGDDSGLDALLDNASIPQWPDDFDTQMMIAEALEASAYPSESEVFHGAESGGTGIDELSLDDALQNDSGEEFENAAREVLSDSHPPCVFLAADRGVLEQREDLTLKQIMDFDPRRGCLSRSRDRFAPIAARLALAALSGSSESNRPIDRMWKVIEKYFPEMPRLAGAEGMRLQFRNASGAIVPLTALSDGERAILLIFGELALRAPRSGMVLIDEIEQHLHPRWQRAVLQALIALLPSAQFILTTQSPYLATAAPDDIVEVGNWKRDGE
jgi:energy-coupling factor transporter ATP-binding protein EcfA2